MDQISFFKKLIVSNFVLFFVYSIVSIFFESEEISNINDIFINFEALSAEVLILFLIILTSAIIAHVLSFYFLYNFKKIGKPLYTISLFAMLIFSSLYPFATDRLAFFLYYLSTIVSGGIIALMYFSSISSKFK